MGANERGSREQSKSPQLRPGMLRKREQILRAAFDLIIEQGPAVPMETIARRAAVGIATLYRLFPDRSILLGQVALDSWRQASEEARTALEEEADAFTALARYMHNLVDLRIGAATPILHERIVEDDELLEARREYRDAHEVLISAAHQEGSLRPEVTPGDISLMIARLTASLPGSISAEDNHKLAHRHLEFVLDGLVSIRSTASLAEPTTSLGFPLESDPIPTVLVEDFQDSDLDPAEDYARLIVEIRTGERLTWWSSKRFALSPATSALVSVYADTYDRDSVERLLTALHDLFESEGLTIEADGEPKISSWWGRFRIQAKDAIQRQEVASRLKKIEHALEVVAVRQPMSIENAKQAEAVSALASALEKISNAVILSGSIVMVKWTDSKGSPHLYAKTLSVAEVQEFERNQHLLTNPRKALQHLHLLSRASRAERLAIETESGD